jgi:hypothetical protein
MGTVGVGSTAVDPGLVVGMASGASSTSWTVLPPGSSLGAPAVVDSKDQAPRARPMAATVAITRPARRSLAGPSSSRQAGRGPSGYHRSPTASVLSSAGA